MTKELRRQIESLRAVAPALNAATEEAGRVVQAVETLLGGELSIGVSGESEPFDARPVEVEPDEFERRAFSSLAYGRVAGKYRLFVHQTVESRDRDGDWNVIEAESIPWSSCPREVKLQSLRSLPELLGILASKAREIVEAAQATSAIVLEMIEAIGPRPDGDVPSSEPGQEPHAPVNRVARRK